MFQYQSFKFYLIRSCNEAKMEPNQYQNEKNANSPLKAIYWNPGIEKWEQEPSLSDNEYELIIIEPTMVWTPCNLNRKV